MAKADTPFLVASTKPHKPQVGPGPVVIKDSFVMAFDEPVCERASDDNQQRAVAPEISLRDLLVRQLFWFCHPHHVDESDFGREEHAAIARIHDRVLHAA